MATYSEVIESFSAATNGFSGRVAENWLQGRTIYGGLTAALCLEGALHAFKDLPPLRSAQIAFIGPAEGDLSVRADILRRGKSVTFVNADLVGDKGLAARSVFAFGAARESIFRTHFTPAPALPGPREAPPYFTDGFRPPFAANFDVRLAKGAIPFTGASEADNFLWVRHRDPRATSISALLALADMPPPAMFPMFPSPAPISSMTWALNFLVEHPHTEDSWKLLESKAENAADGYSSQDMFIWNIAGEPVIAGRQSVAIFL